MVLQTSVRFREGIRGIELELMVREEFHQNITLSKIYGLRTGAEAHVSSLSNSIYLVPSHSITSSLSLISFSLHSLMGSFSFLPILELSWMGCTCHECCRSWHWHSQGKLVLCPWWLCRMADSFICCCKRKTLIWMTLGLFFVRPRSPHPRIPQRWRFSGSACTSLNHLLATVHMRLKSL